MSKGVNTSIVFIVFICGTTGARGVTIFVEFIPNNADSILIELCETLVWAYGFGYILMRVGLFYTLRGSENSHKFRNLNIFGLSQFLIYNSLLCLYFS